MVSVSLPLVIISCSERAGCGQIPLHLTVLLELFYRVRSRSCGGGTFAPTGADEELTLLGELCGKLMKITWNQ